MGTLTSTKVASSYDCRIACMENPKCHGGTWDPNGKIQSSKNCHLAREGHTWKEASGMTSFECRGRRTGELKAVDSSYIVKSH